jgi:hypothetical protein
MSRMVPATTLVPSGASSIFIAVDPSSRLCISIFSGRNATHTVAPLAPVTPWSR